MSRLKEIDRLSGKGMLETAEKNQLPVVYDLRVDQRMVQGNPGEELSGLRVYQVRIRVIPERVFLDVGSECNLTLEDGIRIGVRVTRDRSGSYEFAVTDAHELDGKYGRT